MGRLLEPVLEISLSPLFTAIAVVIHLPSRHADQAERWDELEQYLEGCPVPEFVTAVRNWSLESAGSSRVHAAAVYADAVRQLKYDDVDKRVAAAIAAGAMRVLAVG